MLGAVPTGPEGAFTASMDDPTLSMDGLRDRAPRTAELLQHLQEDTVALVWSAWWRPDLMVPEVRDEVAALADDRRVGAAEAAVILKVPQSANVHAVLNRAIEDGRLEVAEDLAMGKTYRARDVEALQRWRVAARGPGATTALQAEAPTSEGAGMTTSYEPYEDDVPDIQEMNGFKRGDRVIALADNDTEGYFEGEEGTVVGFGRIGAAKDAEAAAIRAQFGRSTGEREYMMVAFDGMYPVEAIPGDLERA
jgi:hypothetical protein